MTLQWSGHNEMSKRWTVGVLKNTHRDYFFVPPPACCANFVNSCVRRFCFKKLQPSNVSMFHQHFVTIRNALQEHSGIARLTAVDEWLILSKRNFKFDLGDVLLLPSAKCGWRKCRKERKEELIREQKSFIHSFCLMLTVGSKYHLCLHVKLQVYLLDCGTWWQGYLIPGCRHLGQD